MISSMEYDDWESSNSFKHHGSKFNLNDFDEIEEPPPVHIIYPRPAFTSVSNLIPFSRYLLLNALFLTLLRICGSTK